MIQVRAPNGDVVEFPDGTSDEVMAGAMRSAYGGPQQEPSRAGAIAADVAKQLPVEVGRAGLGVLGFPGDVRSAASWLTSKAGEAAGISPETVGLFKQGMADSLRFMPGPLGAVASGPTTQELEQRVSQHTGPFRKAETPEGETIANVGGFAAGALLPGGPLRRLANVLMPWAGSEAGGAVGGEPGKVAGALTGALLTGGRSAGKAATTKEIFGEGSAAYKISDDLNPIFSQQSFRKAVDDIKATLSNDMAIDDVLTPKAFRALQRLDAAANENISLKGLDQIRKVANLALESASKTERKMAHLIRDKLDDYIQGASKSDVLVGGDDLAAASGALTKAREAWARASKSEIIDRLFKRAENNQATYTAAGYETALRNQFKALANNERAMRRFSPAEQKAISAVAKGGRIGNLARMFGKLHPMTLTGGLGLGYGYSQGDTQGAMASALLGLAGRRVATASTSNRARKASEMVRGGAGPRRPNDALVRALLAGQGAQ